MLLLVNIQPYLTLSNLLDIDSELTYYLKTGQLLSKLVLDLLKTFELHLDISYIFIID